MAICAERDEIFFRILSRVTAKSLVVYFQVGPGSAELAAPAVAAQHSLTEVFIVASPESDRNIFLQEFTHCEFSPTI
jgi:hypothetical protein